MKGIARGGVLYAVAAYASWGFFPAYWKLLDRVPAWEVAAYRMVGSALTYAAILSWRDAGAFLRPRAAWETLRANLGALSVSAALISANWLLYVWAVNAGRVVETSLGYFITPLVNVGLGAFVLGERLGARKRVAVGLAGGGVLLLTLLSGSLPWISLSLAATFGVYGLVRKRLELDPLWASALEAALLSPLAIAALALWGHFPPDLGTREFVFLLLGGPVTAFPLLWFAEAGKRLPLSTLGFFQYLAPSIQFLLGVFAYGEAFDGGKLAGFSLVWLALLLYLFPVRLVPFRRPSP